MGKTGLSAQFGFATEGSGSFGSRVVPTRFLEIRDENIQLQVDRIESEGLKANRLVTEHWIANKKGAAGPVNFEVGNKGFGLLLKHILGSVATTTPTGGTNTRDHTCNLGSMDGLTETVQIVRPDVGNVQRPFDYVGAKIVEATLSNDVDGILMLGVTYDAQDELTNQAVATASYAANLVPHTYVGGTITVNSVATDVHNASVNINNGLKTDRYYIRANTLKKEQIEATQVAGREITGSIEADFESLTLYNLYTAGTEFAVDMLWRGPVIEGGLFYEVEVLLPRCRAEGETPNVSGPDVLNQPLAFKALQPTSGASAITIRYRTDDTTP